MADLNTLLQQEELLKKYRTTAANNIEAQKTNALNQLESDNSAAVEAEKRTLEDSMKEAYIANQMSLKNLPQIMAARGYNGGMAETTEAGLLNNYQNARNSLNTGSQDRVGELMRQYNSNRANTELQYGSALSDSELDYDSKLADINAQIAQARAEQQAAQLAAARRSYSSGSSSTSAGTAEAAGKVDPFEGITPDGFIDSAIRSHWQAFVNKGYTAAEAEQLVVQGIDPSSVPNKNSTVGTVPAGRPTPSSYYYTKN